jgi:hypothetical protein
MKTIKERKESKKTRRGAIHTHRPAGAKLFKAAFKATFGTKPKADDYAEVFA